MIQVDSREKAKAIKGIVSEFERQGVKYFVSKMYVADYARYDNPHVLIDRKQNINEIAQNCIQGHKRFKNELLRLDDIGAKLYILIEQSTIDGKPIEKLEDIILWENKFGQIQGDRIYRIMKSWENKHNIEYVFCNKRDTGKEILRLLDV